MMAFRNRRANRRPSKSWQMCYQMRLCKRRVSAMEVTTSEANAGYNKDVERHRFDRFCKVVLRHEMLNCFREFSYQNKWQVSLSALPGTALDSLYTTDRYPSDYMAFSADGCTLRITNERLAGIFEKLPKQEQRLLILRFVLELSDREISRLMKFSKSAVQRHRTRILRNLREQMEEEPL